METEALSDHLFESMLGAMDALTMAIGHRLGLYEALHHAGKATPGELAARTGTHPRYVREWLEQQTVAGLLFVEDPSAAPAERRYSVPTEHAPVLVDRESLLYFQPFMTMVAAAAVQVPAIADAFRSGGGVSWRQYGEDMRLSQANANRALFLTVLGQQWLPSISDVHARLAAGGSVADVGCGDGWSSIGIALAYPGVTVDGYDVDADSVAAAAANAAAYGVADRVHFHRVDGAAAEKSGYDLVTAFECVHDMGDPVSVLAGMRTLAGDDGAVVVMDERAPETFTGPGDTVEQALYGYSVLVCLPDGMSHEGSVGTGTVMRPDTLRGYAVEAGFDGIEVLPIEHDTFRFYRLA